jgi:hypothetical protein
VKQGITTKRIKDDAKILNGPTVPLVVSAGMGLGRLGNSGSLTVRVLLGSPATGTGKRTNSSGKPLILGGSPPAALSTPI